MSEQGDFTFENVAPGNYEFFAEQRSSIGHFGSWQYYLVENDSEVNVPMTVCPSLNVTVADERYKRFPRGAVKVFMRRHDLDKDGPEIPANIGSNDLAPGEWQVRVDGGE